MHERFARDHIRKYVTEKEHHRVHLRPENQQVLHPVIKKSPTGAKTKKKFVDFVIP
jgi:hypothetical protein